MSPMSSPPPQRPAPPVPVPPASPALRNAVEEVERHVSGEGWDQPPRLFALVETEDLLRREPALAAAMALDPAQAAGSLTPVEQEDLPEGATLEDLLARVAWPAEVLGAALCVERLVLPPAVEATMPRDEQEALAYLAAHPQREEVRVAVAVLRDGTSACVLRMRAHDADEDVLRGPHLVPGLVVALADTLRD